MSPVFCWCCCCCVDWSDTHVRVPRVLVCCRNSSVSDGLKENLSVDLSFYLLLQIGKEHSGLKILTEHLEDVQHKVIIASFCAFFWILFGFCTLVWFWPYVSLRIVLSVAEALSIPDSLLSILGCTVSGCNPGVSIWLFNRRPISPALK